MKIKYQDEKGNFHEGKLLDSKNEFKIIDCELCGFAHAIPIPSEDFLNQYYSEKYVGKRPEYFSRIIEDLDWWNILYDEKYDLLEKNLKTNKRKILDVGSGAGYFLKKGVERGWDTLGVEPSKQSSKHAEELGLKIVNESLNKGNYKNLGTFSAIHMHEVLEHIPDPVEFIGMLKKMLDKNGLLMIVCPNDYNPLQLSYAKSDNHWWVAPPEHLNYFNVKSITKLLEKLDFSVLDLTTTFPLELFLIMGDNYIGNSVLGRKIHTKRKNFDKLLFENNEILRREFYKQLAKIGIGREFIVVAKKNK